jgi:type IV pilus assembly protein PilM
MALPFFSGGSKKRDHIVAIDLGGRTTKGVTLQRRGDQYALTAFSLHEAPVYEKNLSPDILAEHLKTVLAALGTKSRQVTIALGVADSILRIADIPFMAVSDMRAMLKHNCKNYLQQDLPGYVFECYILPPRNMQHQSEGEKGPAKHKVLVGGARQQLVNDIVAGGKNAGFTVDSIVPGLLGPVNAFELAHPEIFSKEVVALVEIGFKNSSIAILQEGELALSRVVGIGGDKMTSGLAESLGISTAEAEGIKMGMASEVQANLEPLLIPLGRELRASIDFFEHQQEKTVGQVFISGGSARSEFVVQCLQSELMVPCKTWNPTGFLSLALSPQQMGEVEQVAPQLTVAVGAAVSSI